MPKYVVCEQCGKQVDVKDSKGWLDVEDLDVKITRIERNQFVYVESILILHYGVFCSSAHFNTFITTTITRAVESDKLIVM